MNNYKIRTSNMAKKKKSLQWWYVIPVVIIVALVGYVVIVLSRASSHYYSKTVDNEGLKGGVATTDKNSGSGKARVVGNSPVEATYTGTEMQGAKKICASVYLGTSSQGKLTISSNGPVVAYSTSTQTVNFGTGYRQNAYNDICQDLDPVYTTIATSYGSKVVISQTSGEVKVREVWIEQ
jgi:hypothetical protein